MEYNRFYIPDISSLVDIQEDYLKWFLSKAEIVSTDILSVEGDLLMNTCVSPFVSLLYSFGV